MHGSDGVLVQSERLLDRLSAARSLSPEFREHHLPARGHSRSELDLEPLRAFRKECKPLGRLWRLKDGARQHAAGRVAPGKIRRAQECPGEHPPLRVMAMRR